MTSREYRPYLDILFDGFMHDKRVSDKDVENKRLHEDPYLETILTHLANNGTDKTKIASADGVTSKEEFIHVLNYLTSPVNVPDLTDDDLKGKTPEEQEKMRKDQEDERARLTQDLDEAFYEFLAIYIGVTGPKSDAIYSSLHKMFGIIADFVEKHGNESNASDEYDMYVYFDSNIRDLEDEGGNG